MLHQAEVDSQLLGIGSYQKELEGTLDRLERNVDELFAAQSERDVEEADVEREKAYERAMDVEDRLGVMVGGLERVVGDLRVAQERVWSVGKQPGRTGGGGGGEEELEKILGVFNAHHETLAFLENKARAVEADMTMIGQVLAKNGQ